MPCLPTPFYKHWNATQTHTADFLSMPVRLEYVYYYSKALHAHTALKSDLDLRTLNVKILLTLEQISKTN